MEDLASGLYRFGTALAIGAFVGLERQARLENGSGNRPAALDAQETEARVRAAVAASESGLAAPAPPAPAAAAEPYAPDFLQAAGLRTFSLIALAGALAATFPSPLVFGAGFAVLGLLIAASYQASIRRQGDLGLTSEIAALAIYLLGGLCAQGEVVLAASVGVGISVVLSVKRHLHGFARRIRQEDIQALIKFAALTLIILPLLPAQPLRLGDLLPQPEEAASHASALSPAIAPEPALPEPPAATPPLPHPAPEAAEQPDAPEAWWRQLTIDLRKVWLMVILISAVSFAGYVLGQWVGTERGLVLTGVVGGIASSTAVSLTYAQRSQQDPELAPHLATGILLANAIMPIRLLVLVGAVEPLLLAPLAPPFLLAAGVGGLAALVLYFRGRERTGAAQVALRNPFEVGPALKFGLLFGAVLFAAQVMQRLFGDAGLYALGALTGLTDVDPIALAVADLVGRGDQPLLVGAVVVTLALISNTLLKGWFVVTLAAPRLRRLGLVCFGLMVAAAGAGLALTLATGAALG